MIASDLSESGIFKPSAASQNLNRCIKSVRWTCMSIRRRFLIFTRRLMVRLVNLRRGRCKSVALNDLMLNIYFRAQYSLCGEFLLIGFLIRSG